LKASQFFSGKFHTSSSSRFLLAVCLILCAGIPLLYAQRNYSREENVNSENAGGKWWEVDSEDAITAARRAKFEINADGYLRQNRSVQSRIEIFCENGKYKSSEFTPGVSLGPPNRPGFWGQPQMEVTVRVDNKHDNHGWNWNGRSLAMDKGTTRELIGAQLFRIEFLARGGPEIAEFSPAGIDLSRMAHACDISPKKP